MVLIFYVIMSFSQSTRLNKFSAVGSSKVTRSCAPLMFIVSDELFHYFAFCPYVLTLIIF